MPGRSGPVRAPASPGGTNHDSTPSRAGENHAAPDGRQPLLASWTANEAPCLKRMNSTLTL